MKRMLRCGLVLLVLLTLAAGVSGVRGEARDLLAGVPPQYAAGAQGTDWKAELPFEKEGHVAYRVRYTFDVAELPSAAALTLVKAEGPDRWKLNDKAVPVPLEGLHYRTILGIPPTLLVQGKNVLEAEWNTDVRKVRNSLGKAEAHLKLLAVPAAELDFVSGPVLCEATSDELSVYAKTNLPAAVTFEAAGKSFTSPVGIMHAIRAKGLPVGSEITYTLTAKAGAIEKKMGPFTTHTMPTGDRFVFAALGDSRSNPQKWASVAKATLAAKPALAIFSGDMVSAGRADWLWDTEFFAQEKEYFATIPAFYVLGNHEENTPLFGKYLETPASAKNWMAVVGPVLFIGVDPDQNWDAGGENHAWLEKTLAASKQKFIFLMGHEPPYTSGPHGAMDDKGQPKERGIVNGRKYIMPLLQKYNATAFIAGHDHCYERSEPPEGVTIIITGGAGAPLYDKVPNAAEQNPYSKVYVRTLHFCLVSVDGDTCTLRAIDPSGHEIDTTHWKARQVAAN